MALALAGALHLVAFRDHLAEGVVVASFFVLAAAFQLSSAAITLRGVGGRLALFMAAANVGFVALWALSRTVGVPVSAGEPEPARLLDVGIVAAELIAAAGLFRLARHRFDQPASLRGWLAAMVVGMVAASAGAQWTPAHAGSHSHRSALTPSEGTRPVPETEKNPGHSHPASPGHEHSSPDPQVARTAGR